MTGTYGHGGTHIDDVVAVEVTIDGLLVIADKLNLMDFPPSLGIRPNIPIPELRDLVWEQVERDLTAQGVLDVFGEPHPEVAAMLDTLSRADRALECRWWRRDVGGRMIRFAVCRKGDRHVIAARDQDLIVLQRVAPQVGLAGMVTAVLGPDARQGRIVSIPRRVNGDLYGSFLPGTQENLQRALDGLLEFLPSKGWFDSGVAEPDAGHDYY